MILLYKGLGWVGFVLWVVGWRSDPREGFGFCFGPLDLLWIQEDVEKSNRRAE